MGAAGVMRRLVSHGRSDVEVVVHQEEDGVDEASRRVCQAQGHIVDEGMHRCYQHGAYVDGQRRS